MEKKSSAYIKVKIAAAIVQSTASHYGSTASKLDHITTLVSQLHWLNAAERIEFKLVQSPIAATRN